MTETRPSPWTTVTTQEVYANPWIRVRQDEVVRPDGQPGIYGVVEMVNPAVFVVAVTDDDEVVLVELYRYATSTWELEVPAGSTDGESPLVSAQRELAEEAGLVADDWLALGTMSSLNGICDATGHVLLARGLRPATDDGSASRAEEGITSVRTVPWPEVMAMVGDGRISDAETLAALLRAAVALGRVQ